MPLTIAVVLGILFFGTGTQVANRYWQNTGGGLLMPIIPEPSALLQLGLSVMT